MPATPRMNPLWRLLSAAPFAAALAAFYWPCLEVRFVVTLPDRTEDWDAFTRSGWQVARGEHTPGRLLREAEAKGPEMRDRTLFAFRSLLHNERGTDQILGTGWAVCVAAGLLLAVGYPARQRRYFLLRVAWGAALVFLVLFCGQLIFRSGQITAPLAPPLRGAVQVVVEPLPGGWVAMLASTVVALGAITIEARQYRHWKRKRATEAAAAEPGNPENEAPNPADA